MYVLIAVSTPELTAYADAARLLGRALGPDAPELPVLLGNEFRHRRARTIAEEYLESHGYPSLRACCRQRAKARQALTPPRPSVPPPRLRKPRLRFVADPGRN